MKYPLLKSLLTFGALILACSCSDDKPSSIDDGGSTACEKCNISSCDNAWILTGDRTYLIYRDLTVTDEAGVQIGIITAIPNSSNVNIVDLAGYPLVDNVNLFKTDSIIGDNIRYTIIDNAFQLKDATGNYLIYANTLVTDPNGNPVGVADFATGTIMTTTGIVLTTANIMALPVLKPTSRCVNYISPIVVSSSSVYIPPVYSSSSIITQSSSSVYVPPTPKSSSSTPVSSSSKPKSSSSSAPPPSSSSAPPANDKCPTIKTRSGGKTGSGWATRYWDCCKPHCSWPEHANGNFSKQCTNKGQNESTDWGGGSVCSGGGLMTCTSQIPFTIDGCSDMGFAFAAVPASDGGSCGKCYQLTFTGKGKYSTDANHRAIKDKKLIIMTTNIGGDVQQGQFDIMIPGGGVGMFNGCNQMGWGAQGAQYGGLLSDCETEKNYKAAATLSCLKEKCNSVFSGDAKAKQGCLFLAEFMHGAGNPMHEYVEVECPQVLKDKY
jgi:hypothetical protein